jgi:uncharacterized membrane protein
MVRPEEPDQLGAQHPGATQHSGTTRCHPLLLPAILIALFFAFMAWSPPLFYSTIAEWHESWQRQLLSRVCHQQLDRSFHIGSIPLAACNRCIGIYSALPLTMIVFSFFLDVVVRAKPYIVRIFAMATLIVIADGAANLFQLWQTPDPARLLTGALWGMAAGLLLVVALTIHRDS